MFDEESLSREFMEFIIIILFILSKSSTLSSFSGD